MPIKLKSERQAVYRESRERKLPWRIGDLYVEQNIHEVHLCDIRVNTIRVQSCTVAGQVGLKSSRPLSQLGPGSMRPESTLPGVLTYNYEIWFECYIIFRTKLYIFNNY